MLLATHKLRPTFFIGLGGSGGRVVDVLARRLAADPNFERFSDLVHFIAVDTDQNDLSRLHREVHKSNISVSDKPRRIALHRGEAAGLSEDRRITSWVHPSYRFREHSNAGAGQIRLEARYSLHCQGLEQPPQNLMEIVRRQLQRALRAGAPNRGSERIRFHLWASTAGGTGSGAGLVVANLVRKLARELGAEAEVFGNFFLPSLFRDRVAPPLVAKIEANGYAALKEIERFQELRYEGGPDPLELVFDPLGAHDKTVADSDRVERAPFDWVYLIDRPEAMTIEEIYAAAGEAAYLQLFTPILGYQEREGDNFRQLQTRLAAGYFALQNGAIGASVIELPRARLASYMARQATIGALERLVIAQGSDAEARPDRIDLLDPEWKALSESEQGRRLDRAFVDFVRGEARREEIASKPGIFSEINAFTSLDAHLLEAFRALLKVELEGAEDLVAIDSINAAAITPENTSLNAQRDSMLRDLQRARVALAERAVALEKDLSSGRLLTRFFQQYNVSPLLQRFLLIELDRSAREDQRLGGEDDEGLVEWCLVPFDDTESGRHLALTPADPSSWKLDQPELRRQLQTLEAGLADAAKKLFRKEQAFAERRASLVAWFNQLRDTAQETLVVDFWQRLQRALKQQIQQRLEVFRAIAKQGLGLCSHLRADAERARGRGLSVSEIGEAARSDAHDREAETLGEFHLGSEVFHDERAGVRAWDEVWRLVVEPALHVPLSDLLPAIDRHLVGGDSERVLYNIARDLDEIYRARVARHLSQDQPLGLADGLVLEARLSLTRHRATSREELDQITMPAIRDYLAEKIARVGGMSRALGRFDEPVVAGREFSPYRPRFVGVSSAHLERVPVLAEALAVGAGGFERLEDWSSPDLVSFYQACLGVPFYAWVEVQGALLAAYAHEAQDPLRKEPLHVDFRWEGDGLPGLDPVTRRIWEERRDRLAAAGVSAAARALAAGVVERRDGRFLWRLRGKEGDLGTSARHLAASWSSLSEALRGPLDEATDKILELEPERLAATREMLAGWRFDSEAEGHGLEARAYGALIEGLISERQAA